ncbi:hypothetical protein BD769DRAFT_1647408, partial [Suillus cothurnatus]
MVPTRHSTSFLKIVKESFSQNIHFISLSRKLVKGFFLPATLWSTWQTPLSQTILTSQLQLARVDEIRGLLRYDFPVIVGSKSAAIGGGLPPGSPNIAEKVAGREHIYLEQDMIDQCKKGSDGRRLLLKFLLKLILLRELTIASWLTYGIHKSDAFRGNERSSTPFTEPTDVFVSGCGHLFMVFQNAKRRDLWSVLFLNDEGGYLEVPAFDTPILRKLASGDWSVFQRDVITSMGPYRKYSKSHHLQRVWDISCGCFG